MESKLSDTIILKFLNKELSAQEMKHVSAIVDNSVTNQKIINELNATYNLINEKEKLENNPYLYLDIINTITKKEVQKNSYNDFFSKRFFKPIIAVLIISISLYNIFIISSIQNQTTDQLRLSDNKSEMYFNDLKLEKMETVLLTKEQK